MPNSTLPQVKRAMAFAKAWKESPVAPREFSFEGVEARLTLEDLQVLLGIALGLKSAEGLAAFTSVVQNYEAVNRRQRESIDRLIAEREARQK